MVTQEQVGRQVVVVGSHPIPTMRGKALQGTLVDVIGRYAFVQVGRLTAEYPIYRVKVAH